VFPGDESILSRGIWHWPENILRSRPFLELFIVITKEAAGANYMAASREETQMMYTC
jgi:hypothetical protein